MGPYLNESAQLAGWAPGLTAGNTAGGCQKAPVFCGVFGGCTLVPKLNVEGSIPFARFEEAARVAGAIRAVVFAKQARFIVGCGGITGAT